MATTRALEDFEIQATFDSISGRHKVRDRAMLVVGIAGALRATELVSLNVVDVWTGTTVRTYVDLRPETTKLNKGRTIRLGKDVKRVIGEFVQWKKAHGESTRPDSPLFRSQKGGHMARQTLFDIVKAIFRRASVNQSPHALRKTGGTLFYIESDYDLLATMHFLGHASPEVTRKYIGLSSEKLIKYVERLNDHLFAAMSGGAISRAKSDSSIICQISASKPYPQRL